MEIFRRRHVPLTRAEILNFIVDLALERTDGQGGPVPRLEAGETARADYQEQAIADCDQAVQRLEIPVDQAAVARGVLAQQMALDHAVQIVEKKLNRSLSLEERARIRQNAHKLFPVPGTTPISDPVSDPDLQERIRGPRISRDLWGH